MKKIINYLFYRRKVVLSDSIGVCIATFYRSFFGIWMKIYIIGNDKKFDFTVLNEVHGEVLKNPNLKVIDNRFEPNTQYYNQ